MEIVSLKGQCVRKLRTKRVSLRSCVIFSISREIDLQLLQVCAFILSILINWNGSHKINGKVYIWKNILEKTLFSEIASVLLDYTVFYCFELSENSIWVLIYVLILKHKANHLMVFSEKQRKHGVRIWKTDNCPVVFLFLEYIPCWFTESKLE